MLFFYYTSAQRASSCAQRAAGETMCPLRPPQCPTDAESSTEWGQLNHECRVNSDNTGVLTVYQTVSTRVGSDDASYYLQETMECVCFYVVGRSFVRSFVSTSRRRSKEFVPSWFVRSRAVSGLSRGHECLTWRSLSADQPRGDAIASAGAKRRRRRHSLSLARSPRTSASTIHRRARIASVPCARASRRPFQRGRSLVPRRRAPARSIRRYYLNDHIALYDVASGELTTIYSVEDTFANPLDNYLEQPNSMTYGGCDCPTASDSLQVRAAASVGARRIFVLLLLPSSCGLPRPPAAPRATRRLPRLRIALSAGVKQKHGAIFVFWGSPQVLDWSHMSAISEYDNDTDTSQSVYVASLRNINTVVAFYKDGSGLAWSISASAPTIESTLSFAATDMEFYDVHDAQLIKYDELLLMDDGNNRKDCTQVGFDDEVDCFTRAIKCVPRTLNNPPSRRAPPRAAACRRARY